VRTAVDVLSQHQFVVHLVDMVACENDDVLRAVAFDDVHVLKDGIGSPEIPLALGGALTRRQYIEALVSLRPEEAPAALKVLYQAVRVVLGGDAYTADAGVERIRQRKIDDSGLAAEEDRRFGALVGQLHQS